MRRSRALTMEGSPRQSRGCGESHMIGLIAKVRLPHDLSPRPTSALDAIAPHLIGQEPVRRSFNRSAWFPLRFPPETAA